jgi:lysophospholipase L1-like esterase
VVVQLALLALLAAFAPSPATIAATPSAVVAVNAAEQPGPWVGTWEAAQVRHARFGPSETGFTDQTVRDVVHLSVGGVDVRIRVSDVFGMGPLHINDVRVALSAGGARTVPGTSRRVTFDGKDQVTIPAGHREFSDPVRMRVGNGQNLAISIFFRHATGPATWHPVAITRSYYSTPGDHSAAVSGADFPHSVGAWYFLDGVDVVNPSVYGAVVTLGPSTTDGVGSTVGANERYPDDLARHLLGLPAGLRLSVLNAGLSGNQLLTNGGTAGQSALERFDRDVLEQTGVRVVIIWEGTNDIGDHAYMTARRLIAGYRRLIAEAHAHGVAVVGATLQPDEGARYYRPHGNEVREQVNRWIRTSGAFDAVADFDAVLRDPADPLELRPAYDSGDHLHPSDAGYLAIADSINPWLLADLALGEWL